MNLENEPHENVLPMMSPAPHTACVGLANLPAAAHIDASALAKMLGRSKKSVQRAVRRGELPRPFTFLGKHMWMAGVIVEHLEMLQADAIKQAERQAKSRARDVVHRKEHQHGQCLPGS